MYLLYIKLQQHIIGGATYALKYRKVRDFARFLETLFPWLRDIRIGDPQAAFFGKIVLNYVVDGMDVDNEELFLEKARQYLSSELQGEP